MRRGSLFWGVIFIVVGGIWLLDQLGVIVGINIWNLIWPSFLIILGAWALLGATRHRSPVEVEQVTLPLEGAERAKIRIKYGAGRLRIGAGVGSTELIDGSFSGGLDHHSRQEGDTLVLDMRLPDYGFPNVILPWNLGRWAGFEWTFGLNGEIPLELDVDTGASEARLDLENLKVTDLRLDTGASSTEITLPAKAGFTKVEIDAGAASVKLRVPSGVAARIKTEVALVGVTIDKNRFPREGGVYLSPDYDTAENKADIDIDVGAGSISVQ
ncbi:MAG TPA: hypothetical protein G4O11_08040 [Anaerolineae bacterium]|nr:hypothetical protein [Anaerolineae bacterium]